MPYIYQVQTSFPFNNYDQKEIKNVIESIWPEKKEIISQFFESTNVKKRSLALPLSAYLDLGHFGNRNKLWAKEALLLQKKNIETLLNKVKIPVDDIKLLASINTTGLCVPSLEAKLMNQIAFSAQTKRMPIFGLGCLGGVAGINRVNDYLKGHPKEAALVIVTELCSLTFQFNDSSVANLIGTALFGDGAGVVLMVGAHHPLADSAFLDVVHTKSYFYRETEYLMGWEMVEKGFQLNLSNDIPKLIKSDIAKNINDFIHSCGLERKDIDFFIAHPGGPKVLEA